MGRRLRSKLAVVFKSATTRNVRLCQRHSLAVPRAGDRSLVTGSIHGWSRSHFNIQVYRVAADSKSVIAAGADAESFGGGGCSFELGYTFTKCEDVRLERERN